MNLSLFLSIISASLLFSIFRYFKKYNVVILNAIVINYIIAASLSFILPEETKSFEYAIQQPWFPFTILLGFLFIILFQVMAYASHQIGIATTTIANKITFIFPTLLGVLLFNEDWNYIKIAGFLIAILSIFLSAEKKIQLPSGNSYLLIALLFFGGGVLESLLNYSSKELIAPGDVSIFFGYLFSFACLFGLLFMLLKHRERHPFPTKKDIIWGIILGIPNYFSMWLLLESLKYIPSSSAFPIANMGVILGSTILSVILFQEKLSLKKGIALACSILAIVLISFYDSFL